MHILIATEIWGRTPHVDALAQTLRKGRHDSLIVDPYDGLDPAFGSEDEAYAAYIEHCGHAAYARRVSQALHGLDGPVVLIGFSAGAGAVWATVCMDTPAPVVQAACFYGSAIRTMADKVPAVPVDLIFPAHESHFDVGELAARLQTKPHVTCHMTSEGHGFMNPLSAYHSADATSHWTRWLTETIDSLSGKMSI